MHELIIHMHYVKSIIIVTMPMCEVLLRHSRCCYVQGHVVTYSYLLCTLDYVLFYPHTLEHTYSPPPQHSCFSTPTPPAPTQSLPHLNAVAESFPSFLAAQTSLLANSKRCLFFRSTTSFWKLCTYTSKYQKQCLPYNYLPGVNQLYALRIQIESIPNFSIWHHV